MMICATTLVLYGCNNDEKDDTEKLEVSAETPVVELEEIPEDILEYATYLLASTDNYYDYQAELTKAIKNRDAEGAKAIGLSIDKRVTEIYNSSIPETGDKELDDSLYNAKIALYDYSRAFYNYAVFTNSVLEKKRSPSEAEAEAEILNGESDRYYDSLRHLKSVLDSKYEWDTWIN